MNYSSLNNFNIIKEAYDNANIIKNIIIIGNMIIIILLYIVIEIILINKTANKYKDPNIIGNLFINNHLYI